MPGMTLIDFKRSDFMERAILTSPSHSDASISNMNLKATSDVQACGCVWIVVIYPPGDPCHVIRESGHRLSPPIWTGSSISLEQCVLYKRS
jgi:hypothetical protein